MRAAAIAAIVILGMACRPTESREQTEARMTAEASAAQRAIDSLNAEFTTHFNQAHASVLSGYYTEAGILMAPNAPAANGRAAIQAAFEGLMAMKPQLTLAVQSVVANGPLAVARGTYSMAFTPPGAPGPITDTGKVLVHWEEVGGKWLMVADIFNSDLPAAPAGPAH